jgi:hypothetical protein
MKRIMARVAVAQADHTTTAPTTARGLDPEIRPEVELIDS